jgi:hypothetical protein
VVLHAIDTNIAKPNVVVAFMMVSLLWFESGCGNQSLVFYGTAAKVGDPEC